MAAALLGARNREAGGGFAHGFAGARDQRQEFDQRQQQIDTNQQFDIQQLALARAREARLVEESQISRAEATATREDRRRAAMSTQLKDGMAQLENIDDPLLFQRQRAALDRQYSSDFEVPIGTFAAVVSTPTERFDAKTMKDSRDFLETLNERFLEKNSSVLDLDNRDLLVTPPGGVQMTVGDLLAIHGFPSGVEDTSNDTSGTPLGQLFPWLVGTRFEHVPMKDAAEVRRIAELLGVEISETDERAATNELVRQLQREIRAVLAIRGAGGTADLDALKGRASGLGISFAAQEQEATLEYGKAVDAAVTQIQRLFNIGGGVDQVQVRGANIRSAARALVPNPEADIVLQSLVEIDAEENNEDPAAVIRRMRRDGVIVINDLQ